MNNYTKILLHVHINASYYCAGSQDNSTAAFLNGTQSGANDTSDIWKSRMREVPSNFTMRSNPRAIVRGVHVKQATLSKKKERIGLHACTN